MAHTPTVLLVDDGLDEKILFERAAKKAEVSFTLHWVADGRAAVSYLSGDGLYEDRASHPLPDLVILDLNMPGLDGFEVLKWIRLHSANPHLPVVVFSSSNAESDVRRAYGLKASSYVVKPLRLADLCGMIKMFDDYWLKLCRLPAREPQLQD